MATPRTRRMTIYGRLTSLGLTLPAPQATGGAYKPAVVAGDMLFLPAQFPIVDGTPAVRGRLGEDLDAAGGYEAARLAALNVLARIHDVLGGFDRLVQIVHMDGIMLTTPDFDALPRVLDGASELFNAVLGERAGHTRSLLGCVCLPGRMPVELVVRAEITPG